jgi:hypothetical protein
MLPEVVTPASSATLFAQTASVASAGASSTAEATLFSTGIRTKTLAANQLAPGRSIRVALTGICRLNNDSITLRLKAGATTVVSMVDATPGTAASDTPFILAFVLTCRTAGASGTVIGQGHFIAPINAANIRLGSVHTSTTTLDTTASQALDCTVQFGASNAGNYITVTNVAIEALL